MIAGKGSGFMGGKQLGFGDYEQSTAKKRTKREKCLAGMGKVVMPWKAWSCRQAAFECPQIGVKTLQRVHPVQLSDC